MNLEVVGDKGGNKEASDDWGSLEQVMLFGGFWPDDWGKRINQENLRGHQINKISAHVCSSRSAMDRLVGFVSLAGPSLRSGREVDPGCLACFRGSR